MKRLIALFLILLSTSTYANCHEKAILFAQKAYELNDSEYAAQYPSELTNISDIKQTDSKSVVKVGIRFRQYIVKFNREVFESYGPYFEVIGRRIFCKFKSIEIL